jgi:hypothetical protein
VPKSFETRRKGLRVRDTLTPEEQTRRQQDMLLKRCKELVRQRALEKKRTKPKPTPKARVMARCKNCGARQFLEKHGGKMP